MSLSDDELLRYSRHILLDEIGIEGQEKLLAARVLIVGAGGLGCPSALYLGSAGIGHMTIVDGDRIDLSNLQRQIAHATSHIGRYKVDSLAQSVAVINPQVEVHAVNLRADAYWLNQHVPQADVVLDCSDNFDTRQAVNQACVQHRKPLVWASAARFAGQICVHDLRGASAPCYACLFDKQELVAPNVCATTGVLAPLVGVMGSLQATETLKLLCGLEGTLSSRLLLLDLHAVRHQEIHIPRNPACLVCAHDAFQDT